MSTPDSTSRPLISCKASGNTNNVIFIGSCQKRYASVFLTPQKLITIDYSKKKAIKFFNNRRITKVIDKTPTSCTCYVDKFDKHPINVFLFLLQILEMKMFTPPSLSLRAWCIVISCISIPAFNDTYKSNLIFYGGPNTLPTSSRFIVFVIDLKTSETQLSTFFGPYRSTHVTTFLLILWACEK